MIDKLLKKQWLRVEEIGLKLYIYNGVWKRHNGLIFTFKKITKMINIKCLGLRLMIPAFLVSRSSFISAYRGIFISGRDV